MFGSRYVIAVAVIGVACLGFSVGAAAAKKGKAKAAPTETRECKTDKDCVAVSDDCCPCSQGGKQRAIPKKQKDAYEKDRKKRCADTACTEMMSTDPTCTQEPVCNAGICELGDPPAAAPPTEATP
jgi:hypothetical protein